MITYNMETEMGKGKQKSENEFFQQIRKLVSVRSEYIYN